MHYLPGAQAKLSYRRDFFLFDSWFWVTVVKVGFKKRVRGWVPAGLPAVCRLHDAVLGRSPGARAMAGEPGPQSLRPCHSKNAPEKPRSSCSSAGRHTG